VSYESLGRERFLGGVCPESSEGLGMTTNHLICHLEPFDRDAQGRLRERS
jgi:hypothetical protein